MIMTIMMVMVVTVMTIVIEDDDLIVMEITNKTEVIIIMKTKSLPPKTFPQTHKTSFLPEKLKSSLCAETRAWCLAFGRNCNIKYRTEMEEIFAFLEDMTKRLSRPIKDLDDIRLAMNALKEIREKEIKIDMSLGPIEVSKCITTCTYSYCRYSIQRILLFNTSETLYYH